MANKIFRRTIFSNQSSTRSFLVRFIEDQRKRIQKEDIRLEPYVSKGVYTESGAIRPVSFRVHNNTFYLGIGLFI